MMHTRTLLLAAALLLSGCGLFPTPNFLDGTIEAGVYTAPDGDFTVRVPHTDSYEQNWMQAKERSNPGEFYVSFGPAAFDQTIYRLSVFTEPVPDLPVSELPRLARQGNAGLADQLRATTGEPLELTNEGPTSIGGSSAYRMQYRQPAPAGTVATEPARVRHDAWMIKRSDRLYAVWVQSYELQSGPPEATNKGLSASEFADSVKFAAR